MKRKKKSIGSVKAARAKEAPAGKARLYCVKSCMIPGAGEFRAGDEVNGAWAEKLMGHPFFEIEKGGI